jgi:glycine oxidase
MKVDYIIVGQGLAGSSLAVQLLRRNKTIVVFDNPAANNSSRIAAGLFNPVTGKKMVKTWLANTLFPYLNTFYTNLEKETGQSFFHPLPLYRPFLSIEEQNEWMIRSADESFTPYVEKVLTDAFVRQVDNACGGLLLKQCGFLDTQKYIRAVGILIGQNGALIKEIVEPSEITFDSDSVSYKNYKASRLIWCNGVHKSLWFDWLPVHALKGEILTIQSSLPKGVIINRGVYMVPDARESCWKVGATYNFHDKTDRITPEGRAELEVKIRELINIPFDVVDHQWGFRPTTPDRRPILGAHPEHKQLVIFNGLGTKGVSLAPYFSDVLVRWLEKKGSLNKEVDIERFKSVYSASPK